MMRAVTFMIILTAALATSPVVARDCTPVETAPGVKTRPVGCAEFGRPLTSKKTAETEKSTGLVYNRDGTTVRVNGSIRVDTVGSGGKR